MHLDIDENPIAKVEDYRTKVYAALPNLNVLDGKNKDGESVYSEEDYGEEGEFDMDDDLTCLMCARICFAMDMIIIVICTTTDMIL